MRTGLASDRHDREALLHWAAILNAELLVVLLYVAFVSGPPRSLQYLLLLAVPFVWLNVAWWAFHTTAVPAAPRHHRLLAGGLAAGYFLLLASVGGLLLPGIGDLATGFRVVTTGVPPGFAPAVLYSGSVVVLNLIPFKLAGYLALAYLVYVTALDVSGSVAAGAVGLLSCVSCTFPVVAAVVSGVTGSAAVAATLAGRSYGLSTLAFVATVLLLRWRPDAGDVTRLRTRLDPRRG